MYARDQPMKACWSEFMNKWYMYMRAKRFNFSKFKFNFKFSSKNTISLTQAFN